MIKKYLLFYFSVSIIGLFAQTQPSNSNYNTNIDWQNVYTDGNSGKVNRGLVDEDGNIALIFMPSGESRVHKIDGTTGTRIWTKTFANTVGFGINEWRENGRSDYILSGGIGNTQERWVARINGDDGSTIWSKTYLYTGSTGQYDGVRMTISGSDGYIYGAGFVDADDPATIFVVYGGKAMVMKIDPSNGNEIWHQTNNNTEYAIAIVESSNGKFYYGSKIFESFLTLSEFNSEGQINWTKNIPNSSATIPADLDINSVDEIYFGGHSARTGAGDPFDYSCVKLDTLGNSKWIKHYANPRGYSLEQIRNELYGFKVSDSTIYLFGGSGDESASFSETLPPYLSSDIWHGWVLITDFDGNFIRSDLFCHESVNTATEYGDLTGEGYVVFNDTDAFGDQEVGVIKVNLKDVPLGISTLHIWDRSLKIHPNPTKGRFIISGYLNLLQIEIYSIDGVKIHNYEKSKDHIEVDLEKYPDGLYFIKIRNTTNNQSITYKIVKE